MIIRHSTKRDTISSSTNLKLVLIICVSIGAAIILVVTAGTLRVIRRRRRINNGFYEACRRDPSLTWDEYERRGRLTRSRLLFEEELQRSNMIRKSQQSRASDCQDIAAVEETRPCRSRSRTWHGESRSRDAEKDAGEGSEPASETAVVDWGLAEASVERTWQLLHGRESRAQRRTNGPLWSEDDEDAPQRPPTVRLKTPPLLSHPLFRDGHEEYRSKHMSLPTELTRAKADILCSPSSAQ